VLGPGDTAALTAAGIGQITVARLAPGDVAENDAALALARAVVPDPLAAGLRLDPAFTGRVNIRATGPGIVALDAGAIARLNAVDPMITLATVPPGSGWSRAPWSARSRSSPTPWRRGAGGGLRGRGGGASSGGAGAATARR
jgi:uncharacterized membrane protein YgcG